MQKYLIFFFVAFFTCNNYAQTKKALITKFGVITKKDRSFSTYKADPKASAVVLYESGMNTFEDVNNYIRLVKTVHRKIKVIDASRFEGASVSIPYYRDDKYIEKVLNIEAITHNGILRSVLRDGDVFDVDITENHSNKRFTFPDVKDGSILEYQYRIESPYFFNFGDWEYQGDLPKVYSEFKADIPANYVYKRSLLGSQKLDIEISKLKKGCFELRDIKMQQTAILLLMQCLMFLLTKKNHTCSLSATTYQNCHLSYKRLLV